MATQIKILKAFTSTTLGVTAQELYSPTSPKSAFVSSISLTADTGTPEVILTAVSGAATVQFHRITLSTTVPEVILGGITLGGGEQIKIQATTSGPHAVRAAVLGMERD